MRGTGRFFCLLLTAALLFSLVPAPAGASEDVCFIAANDKLYPLNDETMPFWSGGALYVPNTALEDNDLGVHFNRNREKQTVLVYRGRGTGVVFDQAAGTAETRDGHSFYANVIPRGSVVFLPVDVLCGALGLEYSYTRVTYGYLVRIKSETVGLTDKQFIDAAGSAMAQRMTQYEKAHETPVPGETPQPAAGEDPPAEPEAARTVYLAVECSDASLAAALLEPLSAGRAALLFSPAALSGADGLLRRLAAEGHTVALRVDAAAGAEEALRQIEAGNRALWSAASFKTRLVLLDGAAAETEDAVRAAGYCPLRFHADFSGSAAALRSSARILAAADANGGVCRVLLGTDASVASELDGLLDALAAGNCTPARLNETTAD